MMIEQTHSQQSRALTLQMVHMLNTNPGFRAKLAHNPSRALDEAGFTQQLRALKAAPKDNGDTQRCTRWTLCEDTCYVTCLRTITV